MASFEKFLKHQCFNNYRSVNDIREQGFQQRLWYFVKEDDTRKFYTIINKKDTSETVKWIPESKMTFPRRYILIPYPKKVVNPRSLCNLLGNHIAQYFRQHTKGSFKHWERRKNGKNYESIFFGEGKKRVCSPTSSPSSPSPSPSSPISYSSATELVQEPLALVLYTEPSRSSSPPATQLTTNELREILDEYFVFLSFNRLTGKARGLSENRKNAYHDQMVLIKSIGTEILTLDELDLWKKKRFLEWHPDKRRFSQEVCKELCLCITSAYWEAHKIFETGDVEFTEELIEKYIRRRVAVHAEQDTLIDF